MRGSLWLATGACWLAVGSVGLADPWDPKDPTPWHLQIVAKSDHAQPALKPDTAADSGRLRYLHVELKFRPDLGDRKLHKFRVVDRDGKTVADIHGFYRDRSLVVFDGDWTSLQGLYLDGLEHREPLFLGTRAVARSPGLATQPSGGLQQPKGDRRSAASAESGDPRRARQAVASGVGSPWEIDPPLEDRPSSRPKAMGDGRAAQSEPSNGKGTDAGTESNDARGTDRGAKSDSSRASGAAGSSGDGSDRGASPDAGTADKARSPSRNGAGSGRGKGGGSGGSGGSGSGGAGVAGGSGRSRGLEAGPTPRLRDGASGADRDAAAESVGPSRIASVGPIGGAGGGGGGMAGSAGRIRVRDRQSDAEFKSPPPMILYLSCTDDLGRGRIYQVDEHGVIRGLVTLPYAATGLALHHQPALVAAVPREGGKILRVDAVGKVSVVLEDDPLVPQPVDVGVAANTDAIVVGDNLAHVLAGTSTAGHKAREYRRFELQKWDRPVMSVAVTADKHVLLSTDMEAGVYRFAADDFSPRSPLLPKLGGVAADTASLRWAALQPPSQVVVFEGDSPIGTLRLPANRIVYRHGLLSFAPAARLVAAARSVDQADSGVWMVELATKDGSARDLFVWRKEPILDFVVGPRMPWQPYEPDKRRTLY